MKFFGYSLPRRCVIYNDFNIVEETDFTVVLA